MDCKDLPFFPFVVFGERKSFNVSEYQFFMLCGFYILIKLSPFITQCQRYLLILCFKFYDFAHDFYS